MLRFTSYFFLALAVLLFTACVNDETAETHHKEKLTLAIPIRWMPGDGAPNNRLGDPGVSDKCPEPVCLYIFTWVKTINDPANADNNEYEFCFLKREALEPDEWQLESEGFIDAHYRLKSSIKINLTAPFTQGCTNGEQLGRTYAIASGRRLSNDQLTAIVGEKYKRVLTTPEVPVIFNSADGAGIDAQLQAAILDLSAAQCEGGTSWTQENYRDLYSSPANETKTDEKGLQNGVIVYDPDKFGAAEMGQGAVRLYHTAAKIDFQWEVASELRSTTAIKSIAVSGLPTKCSIFCPAQNPGIGAENPGNTYTINETNADGITINPGNKWIGRRHFYHLQPADAVIRYTVTFEDVDGNGTVRPSKTGLTFLPDVVHPVYTGWYRIPAMVDN